MTEAVRERCDDLFRQYELEPFKILFVIASFAGFTGVVKWMRSPKGLRTLGALICSITTAAFVGVQVYFVVRSLKLSPEAQFAITGICGYSGGMILDVLVPLTIKCVKTIIEAVPRLFIHWMSRRFGVEYEMKPEKEEEKKEDEEGR